MPKPHPTRSPRDPQSVTIYSLADPATGETFYVGKTVQPLYLRRNQHIQETKRKGKNSPRNVRLREILSAGRKPDIACLEVVPESDWPTAEAKWVVRLIRGGCDLLNVMCQVGHGGARSYSGRWTPDIDARLGVASDAILAEEAGVSRKAVSYRRRVMGIVPGFDRSRAKPPPKGRVFKEIPVPESVLARLGSAPDYVLANEAGVSKPVIRRRRRLLGIPSYAARTGNTGQYQRVEIPAHVVARVGSQSDASLAREAGSGTKAIRDIRLALGLPASYKHARDTARYRKNDGRKPLPEPGGLRKSRQGSRVLAGPD